MPATAFGKIENVSQNREEMVSVWQSAGRSPASLDYGHIEGMECRHVATALR